MKKTISALLVGSMVATSAAIGAVPVQARTIVGVTEGLNPAHINTSVPVRLVVRMQAGNPHDDRPSPNPTGTRLSFYQIEGVDVSSVADRRRVEAMTPADAPKATDAATTAVIGGDATATVTLPVGAYVVEASGGRVRPFIVVLPLGANGNWQGSAEIVVKQESQPPGPGTNTPGTPGTDTPGTDTPGTDTPGTDTPGTGTPGTDTPGTGTPGTDSPQPGEPTEPGQPGQPGEPGGPGQPGEPTPPPTPPPGLPPISSSVPGWPWLIIPGLIWWQRNQPQPPQPVQPLPVDPGGSGTPAPGTQDPQEPGAQEPGQDPSGTPDGQPGDAQPGTGQTQPGTDPSRSVGDQDPTTGDRGQGSQPGGLAETGASVIWTVIIAALLIGLGVLIARSPRRGSTK